MGDATGRFEISRSVTTPVERDRVMQLILKPSTWPSWQSEIVATDGPETVSEGSMVQGRARMLGFDVDGQSVTQEVGESHYSQHAVVGVGMWIRYELTESDAGTVITHTLVSDLPRGIGGRVLSLFLARRLRKMQARLLVNLARQAEGSST